MSAATVRVSTTSYVFAHGREPRGTGTWAFFFAGEQEPRWFQGTFSECRRQAQAEAARVGCPSVRVGS